jgi:hypothetical protein
MSIDMSMSMRACIELLALALCAGGAIACGDVSEDTGGTTSAAKKGASGPKEKGADEAEVEKLRFLPEKSFSGYDGTHTFKVPVAVYEYGDDLVVTASDPSALDVVPATIIDADKDVGKYFMVTVKKPGVHAVIAKSKGQTAEVVLTATAYAPTEWAIGEQRYASSSATGEPACTQCHRDGAAIDHSPAALSTVNDTKVGTVLTSGVSTFGFPITINGQPGHKWTITEQERTGLVTYLRGLPPRGFE